MFFFCFYVAYFGRGTLPTKKGESRALLGDLGPSLFWQLAKCHAYIGGAALSGIEPPSPAAGSLFCHLGNLENQRTKSGKVETCGETQEKKHREIRGNHWEYHGKSVARRFRPTGDCQWTRLIFC